MIALDTNTLVAYYNNDKVITKPLTDAIESGIAVLPCVVQSEFLSHPKLPKEIIENVKGFPTLYPKDQEFWFRVSELRKILLSKKRKARLTDTLIAQICIDSKAPLISYDSDFKVFQKYSKLDLIDASVN